VRSLLRGEIFLAQFEIISKSNCAPRRRGGRHSRRGCPFTPDKRIFSSPATPPTDKSAAERTKQAKRAWRRSRGFCPTNVGRGERDPRRRRGPFHPYRGRTKYGRRRSSQKRGDTRVSGTHFSSAGGACSTEHTSKFTLCVGKKLEKNAGVPPGFREARQKERRSSCRLRSALFWPRHLTTPLIPGEERRTRLGSAVANDARRTRRIQS